MKKSFLTIIFSIAVFSSKAAITYDFTEYKPVGKHYNAKWNRLYYATYLNVASDRLTLLYYKTDNGVLIFKGFWISKSLEAKLPVLVQKYIGKYVTDVKLKETKSVQDALKATQEAVNKALDQKYKNLLIAEGNKLSQDSSYFRGFCNTKWWTPNYYYDYEPTFSTDTLSAFLSNSIVDDKFPGLNYITDTLKNFNRHHDQKNLSNWGEVFKKVRKTPGQRTIKDYGFVKSVISNDSNYHPLGDKCRFTLKKVNIQHGKRYPVFASVSIFGWHATYCNFLASDLRKAIFGTALWDTKGCKTDYVNLKANSDFAELKKEDIYRYSSAGYFVFLIDEGHIATVYSSNGEEIKVVQAGTETGIFDVTTPWPDFNDDNEIKCYLYLGYIKR